MNRRAPALAGACLVVLSALTSRAADTPAAPPVVANDPASATGHAMMAVTGEDGKTLHFDAAALLALPTQEVSAEAHGNRVECKGPALIDVLARVGAPTGEALRGKALALYARVSAADGYRAVYSLSELDRDMRDAVPIVTASCNGKRLDAKDGPFRIIVPNEKRPTRWVRQVTAIDLLRAP